MASSTTLVVLFAALALVLVVSARELSQTTTSTRSSSAAAPLHQSKAVEAAITVVLRRPIIPREPMIPLKVNTTLSHVGDGPATYTAAVTSPKGCVVAVRPTALHFKEKGEKQAYNVTVNAREAGSEPQVTGKVTWTAQDAVVMVPVVVKWQQ